MTHEKELVQRFAKDKNDVIADMNQAVWNYAEYGYQEFQSSGKLIEVLESEGFQIKRKLAGIETAFEGTYGSGFPVIGILAEYDALPNLSQEAGNVCRASIEGKKYGHGCGHSALGAGAVGAALIVKEYLLKTGRQGTIKVFGCPAEETGFGKCFMVRDHCFDNVDLCFTWHPMDSNSCFPRSSAYYKVRFDFRGRASHAGRAPELGRSALDACELMNVGVNYLREHIVSSARVHYAYLSCGGDAPNVVQETASLLYFVRAPRLSICSDILERVKKIAQGAALMTETQVKIDVLGGMNDFIPNPTASKILSDAFIEQGGPDFEEKEYSIAREFLSAMPAKDIKKAVAEGAEMNEISEEEFSRRPLNTAVVPFSEKDRATLSAGSTDVGDVSYIVPTAQFRAAVGVPGITTHTWQFTAMVGTSIGDKTSQAIARAIARACTMVYVNPSLVVQAKQELLEETKGNYIDPLPKDAKPGEGM